MKNIEIELKLRAENSLQLDRIRDELINLKTSDSLSNTQNYETVYFDTDGRDLQKADFSYRIRREGQGWTATVKHSNNAGLLNYLQKRQEWNADIKEPVPDISYFADTDIGKLLHAAAGTNQLKELFKTSFERTAINFSYQNNSCIEIAIDKGEITADGLKEPIFEIELELKKGNISEILKLGAELIKKYPLFIENKSKYYRGLVLAGLHEKNGEEKKKLKINAQDPTAHTAIKIIVFFIHEIMIIQGKMRTYANRPEDIHQFRTNLRQLRAMLSFFKPLFNQQNYTEKQVMLRNIGREFSLIREYDVLLDEIDKVQKNIVIFENLDILKNELTDKRKLESDRLKDFSAGNTLTCALMELWIWILEEPWGKSNEFRSVF